MQDEILAKAYEDDPKPIPRYKLIKKDGSTIADDIEIQLLNEIQQAGTPYNTDSVLANDTCALLKLPNTAVANDAFARLALGQGKYGYLVHVQYPDGTPASGFSVTMSGVSSPQVTDSDGNAVLISSSASGSVSVKSPYVDIADASKSAGTGKPITRVDITLVSKENQKMEIRETTTVKFSKYVKTFDICAVGGGRDGTRGSAGNIGGDGGSGGDVVNLLNRAVTSSRTLSVTVAAKNGDTVVTQDGTQIVTASVGVSGGLGCYPKDNRQAASGANETTYLFNDPSLGIPGGGGGGGGGIGGYSVDPYPAGSGGTPNGGRGEWKSTPPENGKFPGGGGGGARQYDSNWTNPGQGAAGAAYLRVHY